MGLAIVCILVISMLGKMRWKEGESKTSLGSLATFYLKKTQNNNSNKITIYLEFYVFPVCSHFLRGVF